MPILHISPEALHDLEGIKKYIETELENPDAAVDTVSRIVQTIQSLTHLAERGAPLSAIVGFSTNYRYVRSGHYLVFYRQEQEQTYVLRVLYGKRDYIKILFGEESDEE